MKVTIRHAIPSDINALHSLYIQFLKEDSKYSTTISVDIKKLKRNAKRRLQNATASDESLLLVAEFCKSYGGFLIADARIKNHLRKSVQVEIRSLYVVEEYRRRGIASSLIRELCLWVDENMFGNIHVSVYASNHAAIEMYRKFDLKITLLV